MPSQFAQDLAACAADLFEIGGEPATWNGQPITVLPGPVGEASLGSPGPAGLASVTIQVREEEIGGPPQAGAEVGYASRTWRATPFPTGSAGIWTVALNQEVISL